MDAPSRELPDLPALPEARVADESARAWAESDPRLAALIAAGAPVGQALLKWGAELLRAGRAGDAVTVFTAAAAMAPADGPTWTSLGIALARTGAAAASIACMERSVALAHRQPDTWLLLGMAHEKAGDLASAERDYRTALELAPGSAAAWKCLGAALARRGDAAGAIDAFTASASRGHPDAAVSATLGKLLYEEGRLVESGAAYDAALALEPSNQHFRLMARRARFLRDLIDGASVDDALATYACDGDDERAELFDVAFAALMGFGPPEAALRLARRRVDLWPDSASARYLLASLLGEAPPRRSPDDYLVEAFDAFAGSFEHQLVGVLGYDVPEKLGALVREVSEPGRELDALDAGCGTGLCAPWLRPLSRRLTGVDLSPRMLDRARERGVYDELVCEELTAFLERAEGSFDLIAAADVLIYFGDLRPLLRAAAGSLRPGGLLAVSFEASDAQDYQLRACGRFAHSADYVRRAAAPGLAPVTRLDTTLRREGRQRVPGQLLVLRRG